MSASSSGDKLVVSSLKSTPVPVVELADGVRNASVLLLSRGDFFLSKCIVTLSEKANPCVSELLVSVPGQWRSGPLRPHLGPKDQEATSLPEGEHLSEGPRATLNYNGDEAKVFSSLGP